MMNLLMMNNLMMNLPTDAWLNKYNKEASKALFAYFKSAGYKPRTANMKDERVVTRAVGQGALVIFSMALGPAGFLIF